MATTDANQSHGAEKLKSQKPFLQAMRKDLRSGPAGDLLSFLTSVEACAGSKKFLGIDGFPIDPCFIVQMGAGGAAGRSNFSDDFSDLDGLTDLHVDLGEVPVAGRQAVSMIHLDHLSVAARPTR